jgi:hypothetical protein
MVERFFDAMTTDKQFYNTIERISSAEIQG